jgi:hypothetical protein
MRQLNSLICYFLLATIPFFAGAQHAPQSVFGAGTGSNLNDHMLIRDSKQMTNTSETAVEGTPYLDPNFVPAFVRAKRGVFKDLPVRYNASDDNLEYQQKGFTYVVMPSSDIKLVQFADYSLVVDMLASRDSSYAFFIRLDSGRATLLTRRPVEFREAQPPKALEGAGKPPRYIPLQEVFYIKIGDGLPQQFSNTKKLIALLPDHQKEMENFVSSNKISKKPEDLKQLVAYYNSL